MLVIHGLPTSKTSLHHWTYLSGTFLLDRELWDWAEGGNLPSWSKKQWAFSLQTYLRVNFSSVFTERKYILLKSWQLHLFFTPILPWACLCYTNMRLIKNETCTRPPTCKITPWTSNVCEIDGDKGFLAFFLGKSSLKWHIYTGILQKIVDFCVILWMLRILLWIMWSDEIWGQLCEIAPSCNTRRPVYIPFIYLESKTYVF